jgi:hypothetical protein
MFLDESSRIRSKYNDVTPPSVCQSISPPAAARRSRSYSSRDSPAYAAPIYVGQSSASNTVVPFPKQPSPKPELELLATNFFITNYVGADAVQSQFEFLPDFLLGSLPSTPAFCCIEAVGLAGYAVLHRAAELLGVARRTYGKALRLVNEAISSVAIAVQDTSLVSVMVLGMFELISSPSQQALETYSRHLGGAVKICALRGRDQFRSPLGRKLFQQVMLNAQLDSVLSCASLPPELIELKRQYNESVSTIDPRAAFADLMARWNAFFALMRSGGLATPQDTINAALAIDHDLAAFTPSLPPYWQYTVVTVPGPTELVPESVIHIYSEMAIGILWNNLRISRIRLRKVILEQLRDWRESAQFPIALPMHMFPASINIIHTLISEIAASIPQMAGYTLDPSTGTMLFDPTLPTSIPLSATTHSTHGKRSQTRQPRTISHFVSLWASYNALRPASNSNPANSEPFHAQKAAGAFHLVWPLYLITRMMAGNPDIRKWAQERLEYVSQVMNIDYATQMGAVMERTDPSRFKPLA